MTETLTYKELRRSRSDRMVAGVSGGLGRYFDVNPVLYRVGFVVLALLGGAGILIYLAAALVIPDEGRDQSIVEQALRERGSRPWRLLGLVLVGVSALVLIAEVRLWDGHFAWVLVLIAGLVLLTLGPRLWVEVTNGGGVGEAEQPADGATPPPPSPRSFSIVTAVLGLLVVAAAVVALLAASGVDIPWTTLLAVAAAAVGVAVVVGAFLRLRVGWLIVIGGLLAVAAVVASAIDLRLEDGIGDRNYRPLTAAQLRDEYKLGIGDLEIDLSRVELPAGTTRVEADLGIGELKLIIPTDVSVHVDAHVDYGEIDFPDGEGAEGRDASGEFGQGDAKLTIDAEVGAGRIEVTRAVR
jgi:phage shock protein PspC (stress-responsive transcriptional regulator)